MRTAGWGAGNAKAMLPMRGKAGSALGCWAHAQRRALAGGEGFDRQVLDRTHGANAKRQVKYSEGRWRGEGTGRNGSHLRVKAWVGDKEVLAAEEQAGRASGGDTYLERECGVCVCVMHEMLVCEPRLAAQGAAKEWNCCNRAQQGWHGGSSARWQRPTAQMLYSGTVQRTER